MLPWGAAPGPPSAEVARAAGTPASSGSSDARVGFAAFDPASFSSSLRRMSSSSARRNRMFRPASSISGTSGGGGRSGRPASRSKSSNGYPLPSPAFRAGGLAFGRRSPCGLAARRGGGYALLREDLFAPHDLLGEDEDGLRPGREGLRADAEAEGRVD